MSWGNHKRPLSTRQQKFVEHYLITGVASQAAIRAGYSAASAWSAGSRLKRDRRVANAIRIGRANEARRAQIGHERILLELARVAFSDIGEVLDWTSGDDVTLRPKTKISPHHRAAIAEIAPQRMGKGPRIKLHSKAQALDALVRLPRWLRQARAARAAALCAAGRPRCARHTRRAPDAPGRRGGARGRLATLSPVFGRKAG